MGSKVPLKFLFDPSRHSVRNLKDGRIFVVTSTEDWLLKDGSYGTIDNPVRKSQWYDLLDRLYKNIFNQNVSEMSNILGELYPSEEYRRDGLYHSVPSLREKIEGLSPSQKRKLKVLSNIKNCSVRRIRKGKENNDKSFLLSVPSNQFSFCGKVIAKPK